LTKSNFVKFYLISQHETLQKANKVIIQLSDSPPPNNSKANLKDTLEGDYKQEKDYTFKWVR